MKTTFAVLILGLALTLATGCPGEAEPVASPTVEKTKAALPEIVQTAVTVARDIEAEPDNVEAVLERHGLNLESFEDLMYEISADPELSRAFNAASE